MLFRPRSGMSAIMTLLVVTAHAGLNDFEKSCLAPDTLGKLQGKGCLCAETKSFINPHLDTCPVVELLNQMERDPQALLPEPTQACEQTVLDKDFTKSKIPNLTGCPFLKRKEGSASLRENWHLEATGADFLREDPDLARLDYEKNLLAIIDSGLIVKGNPGAGAKLESRSPEKEFADHGTFVTGIAASEKHGINPRLSIQAYPTEYKERSPQDSWWTQSGVNIQSLKKNIQSAAENPDVKVINVSIAFPDDPELKAAVKSALANGKWVVYAAGNDNSLNSGSAAGLREFESSPGFFAIGGHSIFRSPAYKSNFGSNVDFYAPSENLDSLSVYNPNLVNAKPSRSSDGTSFAAPQVSALLTTMRTYHPQLSAEQALEIMNLTAIPNDAQRSIKNLNIYFSMKLLKESKRCLEKKDWKDCLEKKKQGIIRHSLSRIPKLPKTEDCAIWETYYLRLRQGYFLTQGQDRYAMILGDFLMQASPTPLAERIYFSPRDQGFEYLKVITSLINNTDPHIRPALEVAVDYYSNYSKPVESRSDEENLALARKDPIRFLRSLDPTQDHLDLYLEACDEALHSASIRPHITACVDYLQNSPHEFSAEIFKRLVSQNRPIPYTKILPTAFFILKENHGETLQGLLNLIVAGWSANGSLDDLGLLKVYDQFLSPQNHIALFKDFEDLRSKNLLKSDFSISARRTLSKENLDKTHAYLLSWMPPDFIQGREAEIKAAFIQNPKDHSSRTELAFQTTRFMAGYPNPEAYKLALDQFFSEKAKAKNKQSIFVYEQDDWLFAPLFNDPHLIKEYATKLSTSKGTELICASWDSCPSFIQRILDSTQNDPALSEKILDSYLSVPSSEVFKAEVAYFLLAENQHLPGIAKKLRQIQSQPQSDKNLQELRLFYLGDKMHAPQAQLEDAKTFLAEVPGGISKNLLQVPPGILLNSYELKNELEKQIIEMSIGKRKSDDLMNWLLKLDAESLQLLIPYLVRNYAGLMKHSSSSVDLKRIYDSIPVHFGSNSEIIQELIQGVSRLLFDDEYLWQGDPPRGTDVIRLLQELNRSIAGRELFPLTDLSVPRKGADFIIAMGKKHPFTSSFDSELELPPGIKDELLRRMPTPDESKAHNQLPTWVTDFIQQEPRALDQALKYLKSGQADIAQSARFALHHLVRAHPELKERILSQTQDPSLIEKILEE